MARRLKVSENLNRRSSLHWDNANFADFQPSFFNSRSACLSAFEEVFSLEIEDDLKAFAQTVVEKLKTAVKLFDLDRLWNAAYIHDKILKSVQVDTTNVAIFKSLRFLYLS